MENMAIGIDLGATYLSAAYVDEQGRLVIIKTPAGESMIPSDVRVETARVRLGTWDEVDAALARALDDDPTLHGLEAKRQAITKGRGDAQVAEERET